MCRSIQTLVACALLSSIVSTMLNAQSPAVSSASIECRPSGDSTQGFRGLIIDDSTNKPIPLAKVGFRDVGSWVRADTNGYFDFGRVSAGAYVFTFSGPYNFTKLTGYGQSGIDTVTIGWGRVCEAKLRLRAAPMLVPY
jgi:hypothetical protein